MAKLIIKNKYGTTPVKLLNNEDISLKAKGLFGYLQSKPDGWRFSTEKIALQLKEGTKSIRSTLQELEEFGLLVREKSPKDKEGKWTGYNYILKENINPLCAKPSSPKPVGRVNGTTDKGGSISNIDNSKIDISNIDISSNEDKFSYKKEIEKLQTSPRKDYKIIADYLLLKGFHFENKEQYNAHFVRCLGSAKHLKGYNQVQIDRIIDHCKKNYPEWTMETLVKRSADVINRL
jgi:hypothetical protein